MRALALALFLIAGPARAAAWHTGATFDDAPGAGGGGGLFYTGAPRERGWTCTACHIDPPGELRVELSADGALFAEGRYEPDRRYRITVRIGNERLGRASPRSNFNGMAASIANERGEPAGRISAGEGFYLRGDAIIASDSTEVGTLEWSFDWTAPARGSGPVTLYLGVVDGNGAESGPNATLTDPWDDDVAVGAVRWIERREP
jgi:hypothetical protein